MHYPYEIDQFLCALERLPGVSNARATMAVIQDIVDDDLVLPDFADYPHGALRRTGGGLEDEAMIQFEFDVARSDAGWRTLEFLAWFLRDRARLGEAIQLCPFARPPRGRRSADSNDGLRWQIQFFCRGVAENIVPHLSTIAEIAAEIGRYARRYRHALLTPPPGDPRSYTPVA
jgi:hypothetical protein